MSIFNLNRSATTATQQQVSRDFSELFRTHAPFVWRVLRRHGLPEADLEDACQEVFLVVYRREQTFEGRSSERTWLYGIARRVASHRRRAERARGHHSAVLHSSLEPSDDAPPLDLATDQKRKLQWLEAALQQLDDDKREVFILHELELLTLTEVAEAVSVGETTVLYRLNAARAQLRAALKRRELVAAPPSRLVLQGREVR